MEISTVKKQNNGYLLNGTMSVPMADGNKEYELIKIWLETNSLEPEFTEQELAQIEVNKNIQEANNYLNETSWIWEKYARNVQLLKDTTDDEFKTKYADIITKQEVARKFIRDNSI